MDFRNPLHMTPDEIVAEVRELRTGLERGARRIHELSRTLYHRARRSGEDNAPAYITYANSWTRFAGMVSHGLARQSNVERLIRPVTPPPDTEAVPTPPTPPTTKQPSGHHVSMEDLLEMYRVGDVTHADRR